MKFARKFGNELSGVAKLVVPNGHCWEMGLKKANDIICFKRGWQEFMKFHSIGYGHLLVFRYEEKSTFHVCIFDTTLTEIDYPCNGPSSSIVDHNVDKQPKGKTADENYNINHPISHGSSKRRAVNELEDDHVCKRSIQNPLSNQNIVRSYKHSLDSCFH